MVDGGILHEGLESEGTGTQGRIWRPTRRPCRDHPVSLNVGRDPKGII
jgi:hypothetical protein